MDIIGYFDQAFLEPWRVVIVSIQAGGDSANAGIILAIILCLLWAFMFWMLKLIIWNVVFPKIRLVDPYGNRVNTVRIYLGARANKVNMDALQGSRKIYYWGKFRLFPFLQFFKICIDKGQFKTRRTPWHIDVFTDGMNLKWEHDEGCYVVDDNALIHMADDRDKYCDHALTDVVMVGDMVQEGVKGDYGLIKSKYKLGLSIKRLEDKRSDRPKE